MINKMYRNARRDEVNKGMSARRRAFSSEQKKTRKEGEREWWNSGELFVSAESKGFPPADRLKTSLLAPAKTRHVSRRKAFGLLKFTLTINISPLKEKQR